MSVQEGEEGDVLEVLRGFAKRQGKSTKVSLAVTVQVIATGVGAWVRDA